jgi:acyl carrier protein
MNKKEIENHMKSIFVKDFGVSREALKPTAHLFNDLGLDSIDAIDMAVRLEKETGLKLKALELRSIRTFEDVVNMIHNRLKKES